MTDTEQLEVHVPLSDRRREWYRTVACSHYNSTQCSVCYAHEYIPLHLFIIQVLLTGGVSEEVNSSITLSVSIIIIHVHWCTCDVCVCNIHILLWNVVGNPTIMTVKADEKTENLL